MATWTTNDVADQQGKTFVITGGNSGIGLEAAKQLAAKSATVVLACRTPAKAEAAAAEVRAAGPTATVKVMTLDLSSLASIRSFAQTLVREVKQVDVLINNAGVMALPRATTADGFELQFGTNHLGHFALTAQVLEALERAPAPRVVCVASNAHYFGRMQFDDLNGERAYSKWGAYGQSKLANLLFMAELERRLRAASKKTLSVACHPGYAATNLQHVGPKLEKATFGALIMSVGNSIAAQSAEAGAWPTVYAATEPGVKGGEYFGPRVLQQWGAPTRHRPNAAARDEAAAKQLWDMSEALTKVRYSL